jgi:hypothetical protein
MLEIKIINLINYAAIDKLLIKRCLKIKLKRNNKKD